MRALLAVALVAAAAASAHAQVAVTGYVDNNVAGDVQSGRLGAGISAGYYLRDWLGPGGGLGLGIGLELDGELHGHFFRDEDLADLVPAGMDLNTRAALASASAVVPYCLRGAAGTWCPYATAGLGLIYAMFAVPSNPSLDRTQTDLALSAGVGVMHALTRWIGLRVDARYFHAFVDETSTTNGYPRDYGHWRVSVGITFGGPPSARQ